MESMLYLCLRVEVVVAVDHASLLVLEENFLWLEFNEQQLPLLQLIHIIFIMIGKGGVHIIFERVPQGFLLVVTTIVYSGGYKIMVGIKIIDFFKFIVLIHRFYTISNQQMFIKILFVYMNQQNSQQSTGQQSQQHRPRVAFEYKPQPNTGPYVVPNPHQYQPSNRWYAIQRIPSDKSIPSGVAVERVPTIAHHQPPQNNPFRPENDLALRVKELEHQLGNLKSLILSERKAEEEFLKNLSKIVTERLTKCQEILRNL